MDQGLIKALILICIKGLEEEYIAPISRLWGLYLKLKNEGQKEEAQYFGLRALWYIRLSLRRQMCNGELIPYEKFISVVIQMAAWVFYEVNLK